MDYDKDGSQSHIDLLRRRYDALKGATERANCETHWQDIAELMSPRKVDFVGSRTLGEKKMNRVYDPTGIIACETLAAGLHGAATNPSTKWFSLRMVTTKLVTVTDGMGQMLTVPLSDVPDGFAPDEESEEIELNEVPEVKKYLSDVEEIMFQRLYQPGTNFTTALHEVYLDLSAFGTAILFVGQRDNGGLLFECRPLSECVIDENHEGRVDAVYRKSKYTVRQLAELSRLQGWKVSDEVKGHMEAQRWDEPVEVIHAVYPRESFDPKKKNKENMPYASVYFEHKACHCLHEGGFQEFPYLVARWGKYAAEIYGRSPGMTALPDVKMLQQMALTYIKLLHKAADPPMWLRDDGVIGQTRTVPGGINYWRGNPNDGVMLQPVSLQGVQYLGEGIVRLQEQISRTFFADLMRMVDKADMTATEVVQRTRDQMRLFGPLVGRLESELLGPLVERVFGICTRERLLPPPPEMAIEQEFTVEYVSPIATAQKQQQAEGVMQAMQLALNAFGPDFAPQIVAKELDPGKVFRWAWSLFNNDPDLLIDEAGKRRAQMLEQMQQGADMAAPMANVAKTGSEAMRNVSDSMAPDGGGGVIAQLMQQMGQNIQNDPQAQEEAKALMGAAADRFGGVAGAMNGA